ncbi:MAG: FkbM family methyltransferase [Verrucomicrobiales bacterium]|nr:FkbM family methyltransferase [Verrucomicrobiales bacterium]
MKLIGKTIAPNGRQRIYFFGFRVASWNAKKQKNARLPDLIAAAIADPLGLGGLELKLWNLGVPRQFHHLFYEMPAGAVCIDCGANAGKFTDAVLHQGGISYAFEPNAALFNLLERKYAGNSRVRLFKAAVGARDGMAMFHLPVGMRADPVAVCEEGTLLSHRQRMDLQPADEVKVMDLAGFLKREFGVFSSEPPVWLIKLDIEGCEFEVVERLVAEQAHRFARHIVVETHERFFADREKRLERLRNTISAAGADNIELGWL